MDLFFVIIVLVIIVVINFSAKNRYSNDSLDIGWDRVTTRGKVSQSDKISHRRAALTAAQMFLKPYKDYMGEHCLANENCKVNLIIDDKDGEKKIIGLNKQITDNKRKLFIAKISQDFLTYYSQEPDYVIDYLWDTLCINFATTTVYENILKAVQVGLLNVQETEIDVVNQGNKTQHVHDINIRTNNLLNINSATEAELIALPGINVAMAKRIIKHIEKNGQFNSIDEFFQKMKIKEVFSEKLKSVICANPVAYKQTEKMETVEPIENMSSEKALDVNDIPNIPHSENERIIDL